ncbi:hypothetical protein BH09BAC4_BH09BAC4_27240 [soil metagenome]
MNQELLDAAKEFDTYFISKFPNVENPVKLLSDFNTTLNDYAQKSVEHGETINAITIKLSNRDLEEFAAKDSQPDRRVSDEPGTGYNDEKPGQAEDKADEEDQEIILEARKVLHGDENEAGLNELVSQLIANLEADK